MALKKSALYSSLWRSCDELRGGMDASQYKDYVLVLLFVKYVSDKYANDPDALIEVPAGGGFADMVIAKGDKEIGDRINKIIGRLADANDSLKGAINVADFNDEDKLGKGKEMVDRLTKLVAIFEGLDFGSNRAEGDDLLGDAYEYLMRHFATESGKSKGQFYTPAEVSRVMSMVIDLGRATSGAQTIYDPTCGSGSLLLKAHDEARNRTGLDLTLYGQEMDNATVRAGPHEHGAARRARGGNLAGQLAVQPALQERRRQPQDLRLRGRQFPLLQQELDQRPGPGQRSLRPLPLRHPARQERRLCLPAAHPREPQGQRPGRRHPPARRALPRRRGGRHPPTHRPPGLHQGHHRPAGQPLLRHLHPRLHPGGGQGRRGRAPRHLHGRRQPRLHQGRQQEPPARPGHPQDRGHLHPPGGVPRLFAHGAARRDRVQRLQPEPAALYRRQRARGLAGHRGPSARAASPTATSTDSAAYWQVFPSLRRELFEDADRPGYSLPKVEAGQVKAAIFGHPEFTAFNAQVTALFAQWKAANLPSLTGIRIGDRPKQLIEALSESLLETFRAAPLIDPYDCYQHLLDYWVETMQDDAWMLVGDGWQALADGKPNTDLIPPELMIARYFAADAAAIAQLEAERDAVGRELEEMDEEHGGEDGLLAEAKNDKGKLTRASVKARLAEIRPDKDAAPERRMLAAYNALIEKEAAAGKKVKDAQKALDAKVAARYRQLTRGRDQDPGGGGQMARRLGR